MWAWVKIKPPGYGPHILVSMFLFTRAAHLGYIPPIFDPAMVCLFWFQGTSACTTGSLFWSCEAWHFSRALMQPISKPTCAVGLGA